MNQISKRLRFILLRLRHSSCPEVFHRIRQTAFLLYLKVFTKFGFQFPKPPGIGTEPIQKLIMPDLIISEPESFMRDVFNPPVKRKGPAYSASANSMIFDDDIRMLWEPARLQQALSLLVFSQQYPDAAACKKAGQTATAMIVSWLNKNPFPQGIHYRSAMECALRIPVFFAALKQTGDLSAHDSAMLMTAIYRHGWFISKNLSLYSSLGNHTVTEAVGLIFAGATYQFTSEGKKWLETGIRLLDEELYRQILEDGGPAEQSLSYHRFVLDLYWLAMDFIQKNNLGNVEHWQKRLAAGEFFLSAFKDRALQSPHIGDSDDGFALGPGICSLKIAPERDIEKDIITFPVSGYTIIRPADLVFTFDHGPLGMAPLYNHGHADALSITLSKNGQPILIDPGTFRYNGAPGWRRYFKGTRAHNTVAIDGKDQAVQQTGFIWSNPCTARFTYEEKKTGYWFFSAVHNGYNRLDTPVDHQRSILYRKKNFFLIRDSFSGRGTHQFQLNYHLHPDVMVKKEGNWWTLENGGEKIFLSLLNGQFKAVKGSYEPIMGWFSSNYGKIEPTTVLTAIKKGTANRITFLTAIFLTRPLK